MLVCLPRPRLNRKAKLVPMLTEFNKYYVTGRIDAATSQKYKPVNKTAWGTFDGPCLERI